MTSLRDVIYKNHGKWCTYVYNFRIVSVFSIRLVLNKKNGMELIERPSYKQFSHNIII